MPIRAPVVAGMFYPADERTCRRQIEDALRGLSPSVEGTIWGGIVPHAGWTFSGRTAAHVYAALRTQSAPETVVFFGAVHSWGVSGASLYGAGSWRTPLGSLEIDEPLAQALVGAVDDGLITDLPAAHSSEHSIEVQLPFVKHLFPEARILPIARPPSSDAPEVGRQVARAVRELGRRAVALGSSDLTHYGPRYGLAPAGVGPRALEWTHENDRRLLDLAVDMRAEGVLREAQRHHNACGAGAIAATIAFAAACGASRGQLLHYTTSHEVMPMGPPSDMVGYGAVLYCRD